MPRADKLYYQGKQVPTVVAPDGTVVQRGPDRHFPGVPARDLDARDIAKLSDAQYRDATGGKRPLYTETPSGRKPPEKPQAKKPAARKAPAKRRPANITADGGPADPALGDTPTIDPRTDLSHATLTEIPAP